MAKNNQRIRNMMPEQIRERGRELLRLAQTKEIEIKNRQLVKIGEIFQREILAGWPLLWADLAQELEPIIGRSIPSPLWGPAQGGQVGGEAPLMDGERADNVLQK